MTTAMFVTMASVFVGFCCIAGAYATYSYGKPRALVWSLFTAAVLCLTLVPVTIAIFWAA
ncbi:hypothetical protein [Corynebacterium heidelbergense]|uniref:Uncharacterized protein n=1 Tax=Corynebacterium heidelbergense TaxID=2055947 RepID=A0A364V3R3_9CORY|nr:hypothetical protein [Corynebacterium heidelbergense]RAV31274.1 hypothetical protein DLJ54_09255 [Corynebacterium heidelbergense]